MLFTTWLGFLVASIIICVSPGPGALTSMSSGARYGFRRGYWVVLGLQLGVLFQLLVVAVGVGAMIAATPVLYEAVRWAGVGYLMYLGLRQWLPAKQSPEQAETQVAPDLPPLATRRELVLRGLLVNCTNPKGIIFALAVLPQFIDLTRPLLPQYLAIWATLTLTDSSVMAVYTFLGARLLRVLRSPRQRLVIDRFFGTLFFLAAVALALHHHQGEG